MALRDYINLPDEVRARLDLDAARAAGIVCTRRSNLLEARYPIDLPVEVRAADTEGEDYVDGYATSYETEYEVAGGPEYGGWMETIADGAAARTISERDDVSYLANHTGTTMARVSSGTLRLTSDDVGVAVEARVATAESPHVATVISAVRRGDMPYMSMAFRAMRQEWNADYTERRILEIRLFDVSSVNEPANYATFNQVRSAARHAGPRGMALSLARAQLELTA